MKLPSRKLTRGLKSLTSVYTSKPDSFAPDLEVVATYIEAEGKLLIMQLSSTKKDVGLWGFPAGKVKSGEILEEAALRELIEETGLKVEKPLKAIGSLYIDKPGVKFIYHLFGLELEKIEEITLSVEHQEYRWLSFEEAIKLPLVPGEKEALLYLQRRKND